MSSEALWNLRKIDENESWIKAKFKKTWISKTIMKLYTTSLKYYLGNHWSNESSEKVIIVLS